MNKPLKAGIVTGACSGLAKLLFNSSVGYDAFDTVRSGSVYSWESRLDGLSEAGLFAGAALTAYGLTKALVDKCMPIASERTSVAASLTAAGALAYGLERKAGLLYDAVCKIGVYDYQIASGLETFVSHGIVFGLIFAGGSLVYDLCSLAAKKPKQNP